MKNNKIEAVLSIAGSDPSGGAGIQADLKTISAYGLYGMTAISALTVQNTQGVVYSYPVENDLLRDQLIAIWEDIPPDAVKIGMVSNSSQVDVILEVFSKYLQDTPLVVDPVITSTSGFDLVDKAGVKSMTRLFDRASLITPNIIEAEILSEFKIRCIDDMKKAAINIYEKYSCPLLIKGGHLEGDKDDLLYDGKNFLVFKGNNIDNPNTHGTGCSLSSAIASELALGRSLEEAIRGAKAYITGAISYGLNLGKKRGPLYHMWKFGK